ncbi:hypothetical protein HFP72_02290 [Nocardiopsis sp. ARC36]
MTAIGAYVRESWKPAVRVDATNSRGLAWLITDTGLVHHRGFTGTVARMPSGTRACRLPETGR